MMTCQCSVLRSAMNLKVCSTSINQRLSRLLKLPTEIRNEIYHYVFNDTILPVHQMQILRRHQRPSQVNKLEPAIHSSLSLLLVSRQLHYAARPAIFSSCLFDLSSLKWPRRAAPILGNKACDLIHYIEINQIVLANIRHSNNTQSCFPRLKGIRVRCHMPDDFNIPWIVQTVQILHWFFNRKELLIVFLDDAGQICYVR
jgi:hypothetical protein